MTNPTQEAIEDILRPYDLSGELTKRVLQAHLRAVKGELEGIKTQFEGRTFSNTTDWRKEMTHMMSKIDDRLELFND